MARPRVGHREASHLEPEEMARLLRAASRSRYRPLFEPMMHTGLRLGEALALTWRGVDLERRTLYVNGALVRLDGTLQAAAALISANYTRSDLRKLCRADRI